MTALSAVLLISHTQNKPQQSSRILIFVFFFYLPVTSLYALCPRDEVWCSSLDETEKRALEAITTLFHQLDDDNNGNIDLEETNEFLREELKYDRNIENRQKAFHRDDDTHVSVRELWETWRKSEVHNWTVLQTQDWLKTFIDVPQYLQKFHDHGVNGTVLPILAVNHNNFLTSAIGMKDTITKQKVVVRAMDVVLFGPPRDNNNYIKDIVLTTALAIAVIGCMIVYKRYKESLEDLKKMTRHMAELSKAEKSFKEVVENLEDTESNEVARKRVEVTSQSEKEGPLELVKLRDENQVLRNELQRAEAELQDKCWVAPHALQHWLQYTYELELKSYNRKKLSAERQLKQAKDSCEKLKKKRSSIMGALASYHGRSIDDVDKAILEARSALTEITLEFQERMHRWKQIEVLVGCQIMTNNGLQYLDSILKVYGKPSIYSAGPGSVISKSNSQDDMDDDVSSIYSSSMLTGRQKMILRRVTHD